MCNFKIGLFVVMIVLLSAKVATACDDLTFEEVTELLEQEDWEGITHTHDTDDLPDHPEVDGEHFHATHRDVEINGCLHSDVITGYDDLHKSVETSEVEKELADDDKPTLLGDHDEVEPEPIDESVNIPQDVRSEIHIQSEPENV